MKIIRLSITVQASAQKLFQQFSTIKARELWGAPEGEVIEYKNQEFKVGGTESFRCGSKRRLEFGGEMTYLQIKKHEMIVFTESVHHKNRIFAHALIKVSFESLGRNEAGRSAGKKARSQQRSQKEFYAQNRINPKSKIRIEMAVYSLSGDEVYEGYKIGWKQSLKRLKRLIE